MGLLTICFADISFECSHLLKSRAGPVGPRVFVKMVKKVL